MTAAVRTVTISKRNVGRGIPRLGTAPFAAAGLGPCGQKCRSWTKLKTRTICLMDPSLPLGRSSRSLTIDGRAVRILVGEEIQASAMDNDPIDWEWENEGAK